jgi:malonyl-CoA/methylmalonyl-CoA synthetase
MRRERIAERSGVDWWLTSAPGGAAREFFRHFDALPTAALSATPVTAEAVALLLFTSGTTGRPKSVPLSHANLRANLEALTAVWSRNERDRLLHVLPAHHFHGLVLALYGSLLVGNRVVLMPSFDATATMATIASASIDVLMAVPTMYSRMLAAARPGDDLSSLRLAISGSAPLAPQLWEAFRDRFGIEIVERYGLTETGIVAASPPGHAKPGSVGPALAGTEIALRARKDEQTADDEPAEICVRGPSVMVGYGNDAAASEAAWHDGWFRTGDLGRIDEDGYLWIEGRAKDLIIVGGSNVVPGEVESALASVEGVRELAAVGVADTDLGEIVALAAVIDGPAEELRSRLEAAAQSALAPYKRPRVYVFVDELPRNAMGKLDRAALVRRIASDKLGSRVTGAA